MVNVRKIKQQKMVKISLSLGGVISGGHKIKYKQKKEGKK